MMIFFFLGKNAVVERFRGHIRKNNLKDHLENQSFLNQKGSC